MKHNGMWFPLLWNQLALRLESDIIPGNGRVGSQHLSAFRALEGLGLDLNMDYHLENHRKMGKIMGKSC